jgi:hypothetical protein
MKIVTTTAELLHALAHPDRPYQLTAGIYDLPPEVYRADPVPGGSLTSTGARKILPPGSPAKYRWYTDQATATTKAMDLGKAAHFAVLGAGPTVRVVQADSWRTEAAQAARREAHAAGEVPILAARWADVAAMAQALKAHPAAGPLLDPEHGKPEQTIIWSMNGHQGGNASCRAMLDWLDLDRSDRILIPEYKTTESVDLGALQRTIDRFGYHQQAAWYEAAVRFLRPEQEVETVLIFQETEPPYLVQPVQLDALAKRIGRERNRAATDLWLQCRRDSEWPGQVGSDRVALLGLPRWVEMDYLRGADS